MWTAENVCATIGNGYRGDFVQRGPPVMISSSSSCSWRRWRFSTERTTCLNQQLQLETVEDEATSTSQMSLRFIGASQLYWDGHDGMHVPPIVRFFYWQSDG
jgi:predicted glycoside hydrolase/deacetylase ChbG (UPF0249 family)